jgi:hypothetical protein
MDLEQKLSALLNEESREADSGTPDWILARYMMTCLREFEAATRRRDEFYEFDVRGYRGDRARG